MDKIRPHNNIIKSEISFFTSNKVLYLLIKFDIKSGISKENLKSK